MLNVNSFMYKFKINSIVISNINDFKLEIQTINLKLIQTINSELTQTVNLQVIQKLFQTIKTTQISRDI